MEKQLLRETKPLPPAAKGKVHVNPTVLTDRKLRAALVQMAQTITAQTHSITYQATREGSLMENPHASTVASRLRDFTMINPPA